MIPSDPRRLAACVLLSFAAVFASSCVDGPSAPEGAGALAPSFVIAPVFSLVGPEGPALSAGQADALKSAFDRVDRFRMVVRQAASNAVVLDTVIAVTPGEEEYDLSVSVDAHSSGESFLVTLTAMEGETELFRAEAIPVQAVPAGQGSAGSVEPVSIPLTFTGPGATAASVQVAPEYVVLGPGGTAELAAKVLDASGAVIAGASVSWTSSSSGVTVAETGAVSGGAEGVAQVVATTPTGLSAHAWVYVVGGRLAYVHDGQVEVRAASGGEPEVISSGSGASGPAWGPGGILYSEDGSIRVGGQILLEGAWPSPSPDGTKLAVEQGGRVFFANLDGTNPTEGPSGSMPVWYDNASVLVAGAGIERVRADGAVRTVLAGGGASAPALSPSGTLAYVEDGSLRVAGRAEPIATGVAGRPAWSGNERWLAFVGGDGLSVAPADGSAPAVVLPGLESAIDPAWEGSGPPPAPPLPPLTLTGFQPDPGVPGQPVAILGTGFDWIIPANNQVFWPVADGTFSSAVTGVGETGLSTILPPDVISGSVRIETRSESATIDFVRSFGAIEVHARTAWDTPVADVLVRVADADGLEAGTGNTDAEGVFLLSGLTAATYTVSVEAAAGYQVEGPLSRVVTVGAETVLLDIALAPLIQILTVSPESPTVGVGAQTEIVLTATDIDGNPIESFAQSTWTAASGHLAAGGSGLRGTIAGIYPSSVEGDAHINVGLGSQTFDIPATVTASISGSITQTVVTDSVSSTEPVLGAGVDLLDGSGTTIAHTTTDGRGAYVFHGLLAGTYTVRPIAPSADVLVMPEQTAVTLGAASPTGTADFALAPWGNIADRPNVMVCGSVSRNVTTFFPEGSNLTLISNTCVPDQNTQALLITRSGTINASVLQEYLLGGGIVLTEWSNTANVWNAVFGTDFYRGGWQGSCTDIIPSVVQFNPSDPFWQANSFIPLTYNQSGCGYSITNLLQGGMTPLLGWSETSVGVGYRDFGPGRLWATEFDWQDNENYPYQDYTADLMGYMITHRGAGLVSDVLSAPGEVPILRLRPLAPSVIGLSESDPGITSAEAAAKRRQPPQIRR